MDKLELKKCHDLRDSELLLSMIMTNLNHRIVYLIPVRAL